MSDRRIGTREEWARENAQLLTNEKEYTRMGDELARKRRGLPWVPVDKDYRFDTKDGTRSLADLFEGQTQLVVYQFMFGPDYSAGCPTCSATADSFNGILAHLQACDVTMICVSRAPIEKLLAYRARMGWNFNWASSLGSDFNFDYGVSVPDDAAHTPAAPVLEANEMVLHKMLDRQPEIGDGLPLVARQNAAATGTSTEGYLSEGHGFATFTRDRDTVYHCYSSYARGTEFLMGFYAILDRVPKGRGEGDQPMHWLRRHDEYATSDLSERRP